MLLYGVLFFPNTPISQSSSDLRHFALITDHFALPSDPPTSAGPRILAHPATNHEPRWNDGMMGVCRPCPVFPNIPVFQYSNPLVPQSPTPIPLPEIRLPSL